MLIRLPKYFNLLPSRIIRLSQRRLWLLYIMPSSYDKCLEHNTTNLSIRPKFSPFTWQIVASWISVFFVETTLIADAVAKKCLARRLKLKSFVPKMFHVCIWPLARRTMWGPQFFDEQWQICFLNSLWLHEKTTLGTSLCSSVKQSEDSRDNKLEGCLNCKGPFILWQSCFFTCRNELNNAFSRVVWVQFSFFPSVIDKARFEQCEWRKKRNRNF